MKKVVYRNKIIQRIGGEPGFDFLVSTYCENIQDDESLDRLFGNFDLNTLICLQKEFLLVSFLEPYEETEPRKKRVMFRNDMMGIDSSVFPVLEQHFVAALEDCCVGGLDFELCKAYFSELHGLFNECTDQSKYRENVVERMGGESTFEFLVLAYCNRLDDDERICSYFESLSAEDMTLLQKELILMAFLYPNADNDVKGLRKRVTSSFRPLLERGMHQGHFETMMKSHFSAALHECVTETDVIQICMRLFGNLITFFEETSLLSKSGHGEYDDEDEEIESYTEYDLEDSEFDLEDTEFDLDEADNCMHSISDEASALSPIPHPQASTLCVANCIQDTLGQSERSSDSVPSIRSSESNTIRTLRPTYVSKRIQEALDKSSQWSSRMLPTHSRAHSISNDEVFQDLADGFDVSKHSERTADTLSVQSEYSRPRLQLAQIKLPKIRRANMPFSWKLGK